MLGCPGKGKGQTAEAPGDPQVPVSLTPVQMSGQLQRATYLGWSSETGQGN